MEEKVFHRTFEEVLEVDSQYEHRHPVLAGVYLEWRMDEHPDLHDLITIIHDGKIIFSEKYTQEDIEENGLEAVKEWIESDRLDMQTYGLEWCYRTIVANAIIMTPLPDSTAFARVNISTSGTPRLDSRDISDQLIEALQLEQISELKEIMRVFNVVGLDLIGGHLTLVKG